MSVRKKSLLLLGFFFIFGLNLFLIGRAYETIVANKRQQKILAEIADSQNKLAKPLAFVEGPSVLGMSDEIKLADGRADNLRAFFRKYRSPLYDFAETMVTTADNYGIDYRLLPAIAMQESTLCKFIPENSYNCWGYGIYGGRVTRFNSFPEAMTAVARDLKENYLDKGYTTPELVMQKYTPRSTGSWAHSINAFITALQ